MRGHMITAANNPFVRLKHFRPDECDPKENHATECLAACLHLSARLRSSFIKLLHADTLPFGEDVLGQITVVTQEPVAGGILDMYLSIPGKYHAGVEVKVAAKEDERHRHQAIRYSEWLKLQQPRGSLFSLVKCRDPGFDFRGCGIKERITWKNVYDCFMAKVEALDSTDAAIARALCGYLANEGIVMNYEVRDLIHYADGLRAQTALDAIFNQVADELVIHGFETNIRVLSNQWPRLEVRCDRWEKIFGAGENYRVYLWFTVPPLWNATAHEFWPTLEIFNQDYTTDWETIRPRLSAWFDLLREEGLSYDVYTRNGHVTGIPASQITTCPLRIAAYRENSDITQEQTVKLDGDTLVKALCDQIKGMAAIVDRLPYTKTRRTSTA